MLAERHLEVEVVDLDELGHVARSRAASRRRVTEVPSVSASRTRTRLRTSPASASVTSDAATPRSAASSGAFT